MFALVAAIFSSDEKIGIFRFLHVLMMLRMLQQISLPDFCLNPPVAFVRVLKMRMSDSLLNAKFRIKKLMRGFGKCAVFQTPITT